MEELATITAESEILARVIAPSEASLSPQVASELVKLQFPQQDIDRMNELAEKNRRGEADAAELAEMEDYARIGNLLNLLQSKARRSLANG